MKTSAKVWTTCATLSDFMLESIHVNGSKPRNRSYKERRLKNTTNNWNLPDPAAEKVKQKENATLMLKSYHENQREQNQNYLHLNWLEVA